MPKSSRSPRLPSLPAILLALFFSVLWLAGGSARADASGQALVRGIAWLLLAIGILAGERPSLDRFRTVAYLLFAALVLTMVQLIPLPPALWQSMPGRRALGVGMQAAGQAQPWRAWSIVPGATINAASSLVVPIVTLLFAASVKDEEQRRIPALVLLLVLAAAIIGLIQFSGSAIRNPLIGAEFGEVSGSFANRNHFALFLAIGCLIVPTWAFRDDRRAGWRAPVALALNLLFILTTLATGSRAGIFLSALAVVLGIAVAGSDIKRELRRYPRWVPPLMIGAAAALLLAVVLVSVAANRAIAFNRMFAIDQSQDMRTLALPTIWSMIKSYFPFGSGFGGFDPVFRIHEPFALLRLTYFNHAHNDFLEVVLDAGLFGLALLVIGLVWWGRATARVWRFDSASRTQMARLGSGILLLIFAASLFDYPGRTPMMMAVTALAAMWLSDGARQPGARSFTRP